MTQGEALTNVLRCCLCKLEYLEPAERVPLSKKAYYLCWYCEHEIEAEFKNWKLAADRESTYLNLKVK